MIKAFSPFRFASRLAFLVLYTLLCGEVLVRVISHFTLIYDIEMLHYAKELKIASPIPGVTHQHRSNAEAHLMGVDVKLNSLGYRSPELANPKPAKEKRIDFLGASATFGWGVPEKDVFASVVGQRFNKEVAPRTGYTYAVANAGIGNYNVFYDVELFKRQVDAVRPDVVVLQYYVNDAEVKAKAEKYSLLQYSELAAFVWQVLKVRTAITHQTLPEYYQSLYVDGQPGWEQAKASLAELKQLCAQRHIQLVVFLLPEVHSLTEAGPYAAIYDKVKVVLTRQGIPYVDTAPRLHQVFQSDPERAWVSAYDPHPGIEAHHIIADVLFDYLSKQNF